MTDVTLILDKVLRIVESCVTPEQYTIALKIVKRYQDMVGLELMYVVNDKGSSSFSDLGREIEMLKSRCIQEIMVGEDYGDCYIQNL